MRALLIAGLLGWAAAWGQAPISRADLAVRLIETEACWEAHRGSAEAAPARDAPALGRDTPFLRADSTRSHAT
jgi:hypothetical protein